MNHRAVSFDRITGRVQFLTGALLLAACSPALAQSIAPSQGIEIPGDTNVPFEQHPALMQTNRDLRTMFGDDRRNARAVSLMSADKLAEAERVFRAMVAEELAAADRDYDVLAGWEMNLALVLLKQGRANEAESLFRRALDRVEARSDGEQTVYKTCTNLGSLLASQGRFGEAEPLLRRAVKGAATTGLDRGKGSAISLSAQLNLAYALLGMRKTIELVPLLQSVEAQVRRYNYRGSEIDTRLQRLQCLANGKCLVSDAELRAEASEAMASGLSHGDGAIATN
jgi:tetratricopeptide (TPR) repeat protein